VNSLDEALALIEPVLAAAAKADGVSTVYHLHLSNVPRHPIPMGGASARVEAAVRMKHGPSNSCVTYHRDSYNIGLSVRYACPIDSMFDGGSWLARYDPDYRPNFS
jgi:hypothetical protein